MTIEDFFLLLQRLQSERESPALRFTPVTPLRFGSEINKERDCKALAKREGELIIVETFESMTVDESDREVAKRERELKRVCGEFHAQIKERAWESPCENPF